MTTLRSCRTNRRRKLLNHEIVRSTIQRRRYRRSDLPSWVLGRVRFERCGAMSWMPRRPSRRRWGSLSYALSPITRWGFDRGRLGPPRGTEIVWSVASRRVTSAGEAEAREARLQVELNHMSNKELRDDYPSGNPQSAKADDDAPVQAYIAAMPGWKK